MCHLQAAKRSISFLIYSWNWQFQMHSLDANKKNGHMKIQQWNHFSFIYINLKEKEKENIIWSENSSNKTNNAEPVNDSYIVMQKTCSHHCKVNHPTLMVALPIWTRGTHACMHTHACTCTHIDFTGTWLRRFQHAVALKLLTNQRSCAQTWDLISSKKHWSNYFQADHLHFH